MATLSSTAAPITPVLLSCHACGQLSRQPPGSTRVRCPHCHGVLFKRKSASLERSAAYLLAALICYFPANILPIMRTSTVFGAQDDTILSGIVYLWSAGSWPLAIVVFVASILVPLLKIFSMSFLLLSIHFEWRWARLQRTRLYRLLEIIGPWSMLDIYVVALLVALVNLQSLATIEAEPGVLAFAAVVVLTMLSAMAFDPRLIWDDEKENSDEASH